MAIPEEVRRYWLPILLAAAGFLFQLLVLPKSFPPSHYDGESPLPRLPPPRAVAGVLRFVGLIGCFGCSAWNPEVCAGREGGRGIRAALQRVVSAIDPN